MLLQSPLMATAERILAKSRPVAERGFGSTTLLDKPLRQFATSQVVRAKVKAPVTFLGRVDDETLPRWLGAGDLMVMDCRGRWFGLEQEGFGIVFVEAAACGVAQVAGRSGGSHRSEEHTSELQ